MGSKDKEARLAQKSQWQDKLDQRLSALSEKGVKEEDVAKDAVVRNLRAQVRKAGARLRAIDSLRSKAEEMARRKEENLAIPKEQKAKKKKGAEDEKQELSKRQQKKKKKKEGKSE
jgi:hypothetical protein